MNEGSLHPFVEHMTISMELGESGEEEKNTKSIVACERLCAMYEREGERERFGTN